MANDRNADDHSIDTAPLRANQLSNHELSIILQIEERLRDVPPFDAIRKSSCGDNPSDRSRSSRATPFPKAETRYQRVLLLDGARGTGKTSILLTLIERWHRAAGLLTDSPSEFDGADEKRANELRATLNLPHADGRAPLNIRVIRNLHFDPLPSKMPLIAGIVQAWRELAECLDPDTISNDGYETEDRPWSLMDRWHRLFQVAALGWSEITPSKGLIEQVLDREEQVRDWQDLPEQWMEFVDEVVRITSCRARRQCDSSSVPVFVIMIDDVDLQVRRIRELLPALRLLSHPNVFFLVAAHKPHLLDMLKLDFLGQQQDLAQHDNASTEPALSQARADEWATQLAASAVEKVFPIRNQWELRELSLLEFLAFPKPATHTDLPEPSSSAIVPGTFGELLGALTVHPPEGKVSAAEALLQLANAAASVPLLLPTITYRAAQHLRSFVAYLEEPARTKPSVARFVALETLAGLLSPASEEGVEVVSADPGGLNVIATGDLGALYRPGIIEPGGYDVVLSARPDFAYVQRGHPEVLRYSTRRFQPIVTAGLIAKTLQERLFPVDATGIRWETYTSLIWTEWPRLTASFAWNRLRHPRPDELFTQSKDWREFLRTLSEARDKLERFAYAWIYYQKDWSEHEMGTLVHPARVGEESPKWDWDELLKPAHFREEKKQRHDDRETDRWMTETLPLLARPEIGLPPPLQTLLLRHILQIENPRIKKRLIDNLRLQRERLVTDALYAGSIQASNMRPSAPSQDVDQVLDRIDNDYEAYFDLGAKPSPWRSAVPARGDRSLNSARKTSGRTS